MNYIERSVLSIIKRPFKSIVLFLIIFILGNIIIGSFLVYNSTNALEQSFKEKTGALATIESKIQSHLNESFPLSTSEVNSIYDEFVEILDEVRAIEGVDNLDFRTWAWLNEFETFTLFSRVECSIFESGMQFYSYIFAMS